MVQPMHLICWDIFVDYLRSLICLYIYTIWISSKTRNDLKSLDELTERGICTMFLMSGDVLKETNADSLIKRPTFLVIQLFQIFIYFYSFYTSIYT